MKTPNDFTDWTWLDGCPPDGKYLIRMDEYDEEPELIEVKDGRPFKGDRRQIIYGFEWKAA